MQSNGKASRSDRSAISWISSTSPIAADANVFRKVGAMHGAAYKRHNATQAYLQCKGERDNDNTPGITAVWAEVRAYTRTSGVLQEELRNIKKQ